MKFIGVIFGCLLSCLAYAGGTVGGGSGSGISAEVPGGISGGGPGSIAKEDLTVEGGTIGGSGTGLELALGSQYISPKVFADIHTAAIQNRVIIVNKIPAEAIKIDLENRSIELQIGDFKDPLFLKTVEDIQ